MPCCLIHDSIATEYNNIKIQLHSDSFPMFKCLKEWNLVVLAALNGGVHSAGLSLIITHKALEIVATGCAIKAV